MLHDSMVCERGESVAVALDMKQSKVKAKAKRTEFDIVIVELDFCFVVVKGSCVYIESNGWVVFLFVVLIANRLAVYIMKELKGWVILEFGLVLYKNW